MEAFIIEQAGQIKEAFTYDRPLIEGSRHALEEYARATYGDDAVVRPMTRKEEVDYTRFGPECFQKRSRILSRPKDEPTGSGWRVLVVDDNVDSADSIAMLLQVSGHEVRVAYSGQDALDIAGEYQPDVVLLDIGLPGMDGYEVARRLRKHLELKELKFIAVTGYGQESDRLQSQEAGFDYHLVKPVEPQKLEELLVALMKSSE